MGWRDVGDHGGGDRIGRSGYPSHCAGDIEHRQSGRRGEHEIVDGRTGQGNKQHPAAAESVRQRSQYGGKDELHYRVERDQHSDVQRNRISGDPCLV